MSLYTKPRAHFSHTSPLGTHPYCGPAHQASSVGPMHTWQASTQLAHELSTLLPLSPPSYTKPRAHFSHISPPCRNPPLLWPRPSGARLAHELSTLLPLLPQSPPSACVKPPLTHVHRCMLLPLMVAVDACTDVHAPRIDVDLHAPRELRLREKVLCENTHEDAARAAITLTGCCVHSTTAFHCAKVSRECAEQSTETKHTLRQQDLCSTHVGGASSSRAAAGCRFCS